ncbi:unnamed protein product [Rotaria sordida]|uniref:Uncharacterized protein n=1 Tax=Rotaria sordida TaxID=392033 RepID=A0A814TZN5_9BILA|nr:unnamed protein product [Rotaria sordida]
MTRIISLEDKQKNGDESESQSLPAKIVVLSQALSSVANSWKDIVNSFKTSKSTPITRIIRLGSTHFDQRSTVLKTIDIPTNKASEFINAIVIDYNLPLKDISHTTILTDNGQFLNKQILKIITSWKLTTTYIVLNILRFIGGSVFNPKQYRPLSYFDPRIISLKDKQKNGNESESRSIPAKIVVLSQALSSAVNLWKDIANSFKTSKSTPITRIIRLSSTHFDQRSTVLQTIDIAANKASEFINAIIIDYNLPLKGSFVLLGLTYSNDFSWDNIEYLYSSSMDGEISFTYII